jgi:hypothetical protein
MARFAFNVFVIGGAQQQFLGLAYGTFLPAVQYSANKVGEVFALVVVESFAVEVRSNVVLFMLVVLDVLTEVLAVVLLVLTEVLAVVLLVLTEILAVVLTVVFEVVEELVTLTCFIMMGEINTESEYTKSSSLTRSLAVGSREAGRRYCLVTIVTAHAIAGCSS